MRHDNDLPKEWHHIKTTLLKEIQTAATFQTIIYAADALVHARLVAESVQKEADRFNQENVSEEAPAAGGAA
jgi:hypothetical protein